MKPTKPVAPMPPMSSFSLDKPWWPEDLGTPSVTGSSNDNWCAYFADKRRLAVKAAGRVKLYDTGDRRMSGFSSHSDGHLSFDSDAGTGEVKSHTQVKTWGITSQIARLPRTAKALRAVENLFAAIASTIASAAAWALGRTTAGRGCVQQATLYAETHL